MSTDIAIPAALIEYVVRNGPRQFDDGHQVILRFPNGCGVSIISGNGTYGVETALLTWDEDESDDGFELDQDNPLVEVGGGVVGWHTPESLAAFITAVSELPAQHLSINEGTDK